MIEQALIEYMVNALWQLPLLAGGAWLLLRTVRPGPRVQHGVWLAVLGLAVLLPVHGMGSSGVSQHTATFIEASRDAALVPPARTLITTVDLGEILALGSQTHSQGFGNHEYESTYQQTPRPPPSPGNI